MRVEWKRLQIIRPLTGVYLPKGIKVNHLTKKIEKVK